MLFANAVFNIFTGVFDCTNCVFVFSIMFGKTSLLFLPVHLIIRCELCFLLTHSVVPYCIMRTAIILFVFRIMFFQIRVFREIGRYSLVRVINYAYFSRGKKISATLAKMAEAGGSCKK